MTVWAGGKRIHQCNAELGWDKNLGSNYLPWLNSLQVQRKVPRGFAEVVNGSFILAFQTLATGKGRSPVSEALSRVFPELQVHRQTLCICLAFVGNWEGGSSGPPLAASWVRLGLTTLGSFLPQHCPGLWPFLIPVPDHNSFWSFSRALMCRVCKIKLQPLLPRCFRSVILRAGLQTSDMKVTWGAANSQTPSSRDGAQKFSFSRSRMKGSRVCHVQLASLGYWLF